MITVVGSVNMDLVVQTNQFPQLGETVLGEHFSTTPGGKGANQAVAIARLGGQVQMIASVGTDQFGKQLMSNLQANGVDVAGVIQQDNVTTGVAHILLSDGDNRIIVVPGANYQLQVEHINQMKELLRKSSLVMLQLEIPIPTILHTLQLCKEMNIPVLLNPAPAGGFQQQFLPYITYLTPNETECEQIFGNSVHEALENHPNQVIATLGSKGAQFFTGEQHVEIASYKTTVVDTTGAGDTFNGAFAYAIVEGYPIEEAVRFANAAASLSVEKLGAQAGMPSLEEVLERLGNEK